VGGEGLEPPQSRGRLIYSQEQLPLCEPPKKYQNLKIKNQNDNAKLKIG
jgi:hypothetical protein